MPDAHAGYSLPIGGVVGLDNMVVPAYVGYDIGCGMSTIVTNVDKAALEGKEDEVFDLLYKAIPVGVGVYNPPGAKHPRSNVVYRESVEYIEKLFESGTYTKELIPLVSKQLGTLGAGNHFLEIGYNRKDKLCITVHSGSRGIGHKVAEYYVERDVDGMVVDLETSEKPHIYNSNVGFNIYSELGIQYLKDMDNCLVFASASRNIMLHRALDVLETAGVIPMFSSEVNDCCKAYHESGHNHAEISHGMVIHRKGATHAEKGMVGVIPGNMRDGVFLTKGLGSKAHMWSSSHGAGRVMSRTKAKKNLTMAEFEYTMSHVKAKVTKKTLDESPMAYKDIFEVMKEQEESGQLKVIDHIKPIVNMKG